MSSFLCCFESCFSQLNTGVAPARPVRRRLPSISIDTSHTGQEVVIVKNGSRICGSGGSLATAPIMQDKAYFEIKVQQGGVWGVGLATERTDVNHTPMGNDSDSWVLGSDNAVRHNGKEVSRPAVTPVEGDVVGVSYDHVEMNFYLNGKCLECPVTGIRGEVYPAFYVDDGAILDVSFRNFQQDPPPGFDKIMIEKSILEA